MDEEMHRFSSRITAVLFAGQSLSSAAVIATATVMTIAGANLSGDPADAGLPSAVINLSSAPAAFLWGVIWERFGRRRGLALGLLFGMLGMGLAYAAILAESFTLLLVGLGGVGFARAATQLSRFIAAEVTPPERRGRAISYVVLGGTVGAVAGPLLVAPSGRWAVALGQSELAGPFMLAVVLFGFSIVVTLLGLRPEPQELSRKVAEHYHEASEETGPTRTFWQLLRIPQVLVAVSAMVLAQMVMVMVMGMTSLHMNDHSHALGAISLVFSAHTLGMFAFSVVTGKLVDSWGRGPVILAGVGLLMLSFLVSPLSTQTPVLAIGLFLLGLGWNFCFVGGSALLADHLVPGERSRTQGTNDLLIGLASAGGSYGSGLVFAAHGYPVLNLIGAGFILVLLGLIFWKYPPKQWQVAAE